MCQVHYQNAIRFLLNDSQCHVQSSHIILHEKIINYCFKQIGHKFSCIKYSKDNGCQIYHTFQKSVSDLKFLTAARNPESGNGIRERRFQAIDLKKKYIGNDNKINEQIKRIDINE